MSNTLRDSLGKIWTFVSQGKGYNVLVPEKGHELTGNGITPDYANDEVAIGSPPMVNYQGNRYYANSLVVGDDGRVITGMCPGGDWGV